MGKPTFSWALEMLKSGKQVRRSGWNGKFTKKEKMEAGSRFSFGRKTFVSRPTAKSFQYDTQMCEFARKHYVRNGLTRKRVVNTLMS